MITPRRTRLVRVPDLQSYRRAIVALVSALPTPQDAAVLVPTRAAAAVLEETLGSRAHSLFSVPVLTRDGFYDELHRRLPRPPRRLTPFEREAMALAAADAAAPDDLPFSVRPGLVGELLRFYDHLRRQPQLVDRFEELIVEALGGGDVDDRGAERLLQQTRFLAAAFRGYEQLARGTGACDEHMLRDEVRSTAVAHPITHLVVTVPDWIADPSGLFVADFELLAQIPGLQSIDLVCTTHVLASGFHQRLDSWWPGAEEVDGTVTLALGAATSPRLVTPAGLDDDTVLWSTHRDREEELRAVAGRLRNAPEQWSRSAIVFKRPLPYLYLAPDTLGAAGIDFRVFDTLPLAAEPAVATVDLALEAVETDFARDALVALASSPHLHIVEGDGLVSRASIAAMNRALSDARYLGGLERLEMLAAAANGEAAPAFTAALAMARALAPLQTAAPASQQVDRLAAFIDSYQHALPGTEALTTRDRRAREHMERLLGDLAAAHRQHYDPQWTLNDLATSIRRWIGEQTIATASSGRVGVALLDDQAARFGDFDDLTVVGLIEHEWPERPRRNIFYAPNVLKALGWPSERDRRGADDARFLDLVASATTRTALSTFTLDDETVVTRSVQLDEVPRARLTTVRDDEAPAAMEQRANPAINQDVWAALRASRTPASDPAFHGEVGPRPPRVWSVSALETYIGCPFKFFSQHVLRLDEEPDDEEVMDPRRQGQFVHEVFETFFRRWQDAGHKTIDAAALPAARTLFVDVVDDALTKLPEGEAALERTRLLGSPAASGLGEAVFRMEAERAVPVVERLLEHSLKGEFTIKTSAGPRVVSLRGKADRLDLLDDGTFRLIDYKLGWPPDRGKALQLPIYAVCAEERLAGYRGRNWRLGEAVYLAFKGPKRVVPLFAKEEMRDEVLLAAQQRLADTIDAIERGLFPPSPDDVFRCETCSFSAVCRKDYVGDV